MTGKTVSLHVRAHVAALKESGLLTQDRDGLRAYHETLDVHLKVAL